MRPLGTKMPRSPHYPTTLLLSLGTAPFLVGVCVGRVLWAFSLDLSAASTELLRGECLPLVNADEV
ncbi:hypothetical protein [Parathermosynechococcus lividus]|uniref:hypothetical protein n=1 Tax=Parathermosynechococcus lividus TaxID=33070 RepID=UPI001D0D6554|nr:hypothetical protein [Thermostichus lividus]